LDAFREILDSIDGFGWLLFGLGASERPKYPDTRLDATFENLSSSFGGVLVYGGIIID